MSPDFGGTIEEVPSAMGNVVQSLGRTLVCVSFSVDKSEMSGLFRVGDKA